MCTHLLSIYPLYTSTWYQRTRLGLGFLTAAGCPKTPQPPASAPPPRRLIHPSRGGPSTQQPPAPPLFPVRRRSSPSRAPLLMSPWSSAALLRATPVRAPSSAHRPSSPAHGGAARSPFPGFAQGAGADFPAGGLLLPVAASPAPHLARPRSVPAGRVKQ
jgi:hypothetical protein